MKLLDLFFAARPMLHLPIWSIYLVSLFYHHQLSHEHFGWANVGLFIGLSLLASGAYFLNQIYDYDSDRINRKLGFLHLGFLTKIEMMVIYLMVSLVAIGWALLGSVLLLIVFLQLFVLGYIYSAPPLRLKDRPLAGLAVNAYAFGFLIPFTVMPELTLHNAGMLRLDKPIYFFLAVASIYLLTTLPDREGDRATGKWTIAVIMNHRVVKLLAFLLMLCGAYVANRSQLSLLTLVSLVSVLPIVVTLFVRSEKLELFAAKLPILLLTLLAGYFYPGYLLFIVVLLILTRIYYKKRFDLVYPKLT